MCTRQLCPLDGPHLYPNGRSLNLPGTFLTATSTFGKFYEVGVTPVWQMANMGFWNGQILGVCLDQLQ